MRSTLSLFVFVLLTSSAFAGSNKITYQDERFFASNRDHIRYLERCKHCRDHTLTKKYHVVCPRRTHQIARANIFHRSTYQMLGISKYARLGFICLKTRRPAGRKRQIFKERFRKLRREVYATKTCSRDEYMFRTSGIHKSPKLRLFWRSAQKVGFSQKVYELVQGREREKMNLRKRGDQKVFCNQGTYGKKLRCHKLILQHGRHYTCAQFFSPFIGKRWKPRKRRR